MKFFKTFKKLKRFVKYHIGPKEVVNKCEMNNYIPDNFIDSSFCLYVVGDKRYTKDKEEYYNFLLTTFKQEYDL